MRTLGMQEIAMVSGGADFHIGTDGISVDFDSGEIGMAYDWAVDAMADFFQWWDPAGYYSRS